MLKSIDLVIGLKILCNPHLDQQTIAKEIGCVPSQVSKALKILRKTNLFYEVNKHFQPNYQAWKELLPSIKYFFPATKSGLAVGLPTAYGAPPISDEIDVGPDPLPVWPYGNGKIRGVGIEPLHPCVPKSLSENPDKQLYELLVLIDAMRIGRARERNLGKKLILNAIENLSKKVKI